MPRDFFDPTPEHQIVFLIGTTTLREAERLVEACERCRPYEPEGVTGVDPHHVPPVNVRERAKPIELDLVNPVGMVERFRPARQTHGMHVGKAHGHSR
jgi:hypothetical protein